MLKRISIYLNEMFPITSFIGTLLMSLGVQLVYLRLFHIGPKFHIQMLFSGIVLTGISLLMRVMDEFKDYPDDLKNYPHRPLPSGRVERKDLKIIAYICVAVVLLLSLTSQKLLIWALVCLGYTVLMLKWFFIEGKMRKSLPLAFISHHPIVLLNFIYLILGMTITFPGVTWEKVYYILPLCLMFTNWEVARKIRAPEQETEYVTYSMIFGPRVAISISIFLQLIYIVTMFLIFKEINGPLSLRIAFGVLMGLMTLPSWKFLFTLKINKPLKQNAEGQILIMVGFLIAAALL